MNSKIMNADKVTIPFVSKTGYENNTQKKDSHFIRGEISFLIIGGDKNPTIIRQSLKLDEVWMSLSHTCNWPPSKSELSIRRKIFKIENWENKKSWYERNNKKNCITKKCSINDHEKKRTYKKLNQNQLEVFESNWELSKNTIYSLDSIISGSNPSGAIKNLKQNSIIINTRNREYDKKYSHFRIVLSLFFDKDNPISPNLKNKLDFEGFLKKYPITSELISTVCDERIPYNVRQKFINKIQLKAKRDIKEAKYYGHDIIRTISKARNEFYKNMNDWKDEYLPNLNVDAYQRCHIKPVHKIKEEMMSEFWAEKDLNSKAKEIKSPSNGVFLEEALHRKFDNGQAYISEKGTIIEYDKTSNKWLPSILLDKVYLKDLIRIKYFKYHREFIKKP